MRERFLKIELRMNVIHAMVNVAPFRRENGHIWQLGGSSSSKLGFPAFNYVCDDVSNFPDLIWEMKCWSCHLWLKLRHMNGDRRGIHYPTRIDPIIVAFFCENSIPMKLNFPVNIFFNLVFVGNSLNSNENIRNEIIFPDIVWTRKNYFSTLWKCLTTMSIYSTDSQKSKRQFQAKTENSRHTANYNNLDTFHRKTFNWMKPHKLLQLSVN